MKGERKFSPLLDTIVSHFVRKGISNGIILRGRKCGGDRRKDPAQSSGIVFKGRKSKILQQGSYFLLHKQHQAIKGLLGVRRRKRITSASGATFIGRKINIFF